MPAIFDHSIDGAGGGRRPEQPPLFLAQARRGALDLLRPRRLQEGTDRLAKRSASRRLFSASGRNVLAMDLRMAAVAMCPRYGQAAVLSQHRQCKGDGGPILVAAMEQDAW